MSHTTHHRKVWYCENCGRTWERGNEPEGFQIVCECGWLMFQGEMTFQRPKPDPDPLETLLIDALAEVPVPSDPPEGP